MIDEIILCLAIVIAILLGRISNGRKSFQLSLPFEKKNNYGDILRSQSGRREL
jgi:hypothetical protein